MCVFRAPSFVFLPICRFLVDEVLSLVFPKATLRTRGQTRRAPSGFHGRPAYAPTGHGTCAGGHQGQVQAGGLRGERGQQPAARSAIGPRRGALKVAGHHKTNSSHLENVILVIQFLGHYEP